jgi:hypothetical protein
MGNAASATIPKPNAATNKLHAAISRFEVSKIQQLIALPKEAADPNAYRPPAENERMVLFGLKRMHHEQVFALNSAGRVANEILLSLERLEKEGVALTWTPAMVANVLLALVAGGLDVTADIEKTVTPSGEIRGSTSLLEAFRKIISGPKDAEVRAARAEAVAPALLVALNAPQAAGMITTTDLLLWTSVAQQSLLEFVAKSVPFVTVAAPGAGAGAGAGAEAASASAKVNPLLYAIDTANTSMVKQLLDGGANANVRDGSSPQCTALMRCTGDFDPRSASDVARRGTLALVELVLQHGGDVAALDKNGRSALHHFAGSKSPALSAAVRRVVLVRLIRGGASIDQADGSGKAPIDLAIARGDPATARVMRAEVKWMHRRHAILAFWRLREEEGGTPRAVSSSADAGFSR